MILKMHLILDNCHTLFLFSNIFLTASVSKGFFNSTMKLSKFVLLVTSPSTPLLSLGICYIYYFGGLHKK